ncbi:PI-PLC X domain-containing protein 1 [Betta splendens]|uniref:PI-PLC X domain-containing protein 1 n=1 Tax=Betta splendens TaxID=158456 RepID=A0A6P7L7V6_BETSP|nr:PI-PLC X domain-containing protein 1 [Betta splendens]XP_055362636.1 PI-PLC X domain-containing protein 1 [Betta splendens]
MEAEQRKTVGGNADWMSRLPRELLEVPLWNLAIPGSHDSMSFCLDVSSPVLRSEPCLLRLTDWLFPCWTRPCVYRWATTQQSVLSEQCDLGIRFFDLRITKKPTGGNKLFFAHGIYTLITVKEALDELAAWLQTHPKEIVIISCSHFESLTDEDHEHLVEFIVTLFKEKLCCSMETPSLHSCWSRGQQVVVTYSNQQVVLEHPELWPEIPYCYADSSDPRKVIAYLDNQKLKGRPDRFYVSGLNLTEDAPYILLHPFQNMKEMTAKALSLLLTWASEQRAGPEADAINIICCDFVGLSEFCSLVIDLNYRALDSTLDARPVCWEPTPCISDEIGHFHSNQIQIS